MPGAAPEGAAVRAASWLEQLRQPVDGASLAVFRMLFGVILLVDVWRYWDSIPVVFQGPTFHFKYYGFEWVEPWPGDGMYWHFAAMGVAAALITIGLFYRAAAVAFFLLFTYMFLVDQAMYLNHFYLVCLLAFLICWLPADRTWAAGAGRYPKELRGTVPRWAPLSLMLFMEVLLLYAGIVKINSDWLQGYPLIMWFGKRAHYDVIGPLLAQEWFAVVSSYLAIALHLVGAPLLFFRRTRLITFLAYGFFHMSNAMIWSIGIFPFITIAGTLMFFDADWPRTLARKVAPGFHFPRERPELHPVTGPVPRLERISLAVIGVFLAYNVLMPMRPLLYPGDVAWTEEGHRFSWRMKLRDKSGQLDFLVRNPKSGQGWRIDPMDALARWQATEMILRPDMVLQFAHRLAREWKERHGMDVQVFARNYVSLNGRPLAPIIDQQHDLAATPRDLRPAAWIMPLDPSLKPGARLDEIRGEPRDEREED